MNYKRKHIPLKLSPESLITIINLVINNPLNHICDGDMELFKSTIERIRVLNEVKK